MFSRPCESTRRCAFYQGCKLLSEAQREGGREGSAPIRLKGSADRGRAATVRLEVLVSSTTTAGEDETSGRDGQGSKPLGNQLPA